MTDSGLTIKHLKKEDSGYYQVTLKNIAGTTEVVIQLIVKCMYLHSFRFSVFFDLEDLFRD